MELRQSYSGRYDKAPKSEAEQHQVGDEVEVKEGVFITVSNSTPYEYFGLVSRLVEAKAETVERATKMVNPERENKAVKPAKANKESK